MAALGFVKSPGLNKMFSRNESGTKINDLRNHLETNYKILTGEVAVDRLRIDDLFEILEYGWDKKDVQRMLNEHDFQAIGCLAAWIRECGNTAHGPIVEDDPYIWPLDEDGNYIDENHWGCC